MAEIKTPLKRLNEGESYTAGAREFVITEDHSFADIIRFLISEGCNKQEAVSLYESEEPAKEIQIKGELARDGSGLKTVLTECSRGQKCT